MAIYESFTCKKAAPDEPLENVEKGKNVYS